MMKTAFNHEVNLSELVCLRNQGLNNKQIAQRVGCAPGTVTKYLPSQRKSRAQLSDKDKQDIVELFKDGNTASEIAETYSCDVGTIYRILRANGLRSKPKKEEPVKQAEPEVKEEPVKQDIPEQQYSSGRMTVYQIGLFDGWNGTYRVNLTEHTVEFPEVPKTMEKKDLGFYIRDLMQIWKEM